MHDVACEFARAVVRSKAQAKRSQHANATYRNIVGRNMLRVIGHLVATCCDVLGVVSSNLTSFKLEPTTANMSQQGRQTHATCCAQQCCDMLCWHVAIVWPGLKDAKKQLARTSLSLTILFFQKIFLKGSHYEARH